MPEPAHLGLKSRQRVGLLPNEPQLHPNTVVPAMCEADLAEPCAEDANGATIEPKPVERLAQYAARNHDAIDALIDHGRGSRLGHVLRSTGVEQSKAAVRVIQNDAR